MRSSSRRITATCLVAVVGGALAFAPALPDTDADTRVVHVSEAAAVLAPAGYELTDMWYPSHDGVTLHAAVYLPADRAEDEKHPVILSVTPYTSPNGGATGVGFLDDEIPVRFPELFEHPAFVEGRYAYVAADVRGFGGSGGCFQYYEDDEYLDMDTHVEAMATAGWSTGKVGLWGKSYDAAQEVLALGDPTDGLAAAVIQAPGLSAYTALWQNGVHYATGRYGTTSVYVADDVFPTTSLGSATEPRYTTAQVDGADGRAECAVDWHGMNLIGDRSSAYWVDKEPYRKVVEQGSDVPVLWHNGFWDANTKPVGLDVVQALTGDVEVIWGQWDHKRGNETQYIGRDGFLDQSFRFFEEHLLGRTPAIDDPKALIQSGGPQGTWRFEEQWPPADVAEWAMPLNDGSYLDLPEIVDGTPGNGDGIWSITEALPHDAHIAGQPVLDARVIPFNVEQHLTARLYDIGPDGRAHLISRVGYATPATPVPGVDVALAMNPNDWIVRAGHRLGLYVNASEDDWFTPGVSGQTVHVVDGVLRLPLIATARTAFTEGGSSNFSSPFPITLSEATIAANEVDGVPPAQSAG